MAITSAIHNFGSRVYNGINKENLKSFMKTALKTASVVTLPVISLFALANIPSAKAGPVEYAACIKGCMMLPIGPFKAACLVACIPALAIPAP